MWDYNSLKKEVRKLSEKKSEYVWDELEELINDSYFDEIITNENYDELNEMLMAIEPE
ncbi:MAG: hypothetical protein K6G11_10110 [Lachnospiraceae bacterium]|nr:hypothetical protein [Lachnospiraceae bacterium]